jgi:hypothetical protein
MTSHTASNQTTAKQMSEPKICMDLIDSSCGFMPRHSCFREMSRIKSCQDFSLYVDQEGPGNCSRIIHQSSYSRRPPETGSNKQQYTLQCTAGPYDNHDLLHTKKVHRDFRKPSPRVLYNFCIGRITDLESRATPSVSRYDLSS